MLLCPPVFQEQPQSPVFKALSINSKSLKTLCGPGHTHPPAHWPGTHVGTLCDERFPFRGGHRNCLEPLKTWVPMEQVCVGSRPSMSDDVSYCCSVGCTLQSSGPGLLTCGSWIHRSSTSWLMWDPHSPTPRNPDSWGPRLPAY